MGACHCRTVSRERRSEGLMLKTSPQIAALVGSKYGTLVLGDGVETVG